MKRNAALAVLVLVAAVHLLAQVPTGWMLRIDRSAGASDPDAPGAIKMDPTGSGLHVTTPQAAVFWNSANTASGNFPVKGTCTQNKANGVLRYSGMSIRGSS